MTISRTSTSANTSACCDVAMRTDLGTHGILKSERMALKAHIPVSQVVTLPVDEEKVLVRLVQVDHAILAILPRR